MGTRPIIYKYPLDLTGHNPNNLVLGEPKKLPDGLNRAVVPNYGAFFTDSLRVREVSSGRLLVPKEDYQAVQLYQEATQKSGLEVCAVVVVTNTSVDSDIEIDYQAIGGEFSYSVSGLRNLLDDLDLDSRPVRWGDVLGKPNAYPPAPHLHDAGDLYGFEYLVEAIDSLRHAIMVGQEAALDELRDYIAVLESRIDALKAQQRSKADLKALFDQWYQEQKENEWMSDHLVDGDNPHGTSAANVTGLSRVTNDPLLTLADAVEGIGIDEALSVHLSATNPHYTSVSSLGLTRFNANVPLLTTQTTITAITNFPYG